MNGRIDVERIGGLAGFGGPGSHLRSRGSVEAGSLSSPDRAAVDALFARRPLRAAGKPDAFRYRITRDGRDVELDEDDLPPVLRDCVRDELA